ncbi:hypothetical protein Sfulv_03000 [Streptomyces fulvorobeus]|uniref:Uncharacterized protein n=1 Tax=Streptomyces fulvorobeus TaxID=284028 RepID=A0A7J0BZ10_9ACTN|nr:hypothetical protein Sfulv_03000 [Streptomyces fulvorobeus]
MYIEIDSKSVEYRPVGLQPPFRCGTVEPIAPPGSPVPVGRFCALRALDATPAGGSPARRSEYRPINLYSPDRLLPLRMTAGTRGRRKDLMANHQGSVKR